MSYYEEQTARQEAYRKWLESLEIGSSCVTRRRGLGLDSFTVFIVIRLTKTHIVCRKASSEYELRFQRETGREIGKGYNRNTIEPYTPEIKKEMRHIGLVQAVSNVAYDFQRTIQCENLSDEILERMLAVLREAQLEVKAKATKEV